MRNRNKTAGNRICDLPACRTVPQPTAQPGAPSVLQTFTKIPHTIKYQFSYFTLSTRCFILRVSFLGNLKLIFFLLLEFLSC